MPLIARADKFSEYLREIDVGAAVVACPEARTYYNQPQFRPMTFGEAIDDLAADGPANSGVVDDYGNPVDNQEWAWWAWASTRDVMADDARHSFVDILQRPSYGRIALTKIFDQEDPAWVAKGCTAYEEEHFCGLAGVPYPYQP